MSDNEIRPTPIFLSRIFTDKYTGTEEEVKSKSAVCSGKSGIDGEIAMTTKGRAAARIRRAERIVCILYDVIVPIIARVRELRLAF
jgi:hypothetical protein